MSLNWQEIDCILDELMLPGCFIQKIKQPDFRTLVLDLYRPGEAFPLLFSLQDRRIRLNRTRHVPPNTKGSQRFAQLLRSHIQGGRIVAAEHVHHDRIVRIDIRHGDEDSSLWFRLWGGKANILYTDSTGIIIDAFLRRPQHGEISGAPLQVTEPAQPPDPQAFPVRSTSYTRQEPDFNSAIDQEYYHQERADAIAQLQRTHTRQLQTRAAKLRKQQQDLGRAQSERDRIEQYQTWGNLLLTHMHTITPGPEPVVSVTDYNGSKLEIPVDPGLSLPENANRLFGKAKKASQGAERTRHLLENVTEELLQIEARIESISEHPEQLLEQTRTTSTPAPRLAANIPGLQFCSGECSIIVGRAAAENDTLLRRHVKGNDWWLHTRDTPGAYVFIKPPPGKSVPLEVLLDAGNLAVWYSKAKSAGKADLFYTQVKYLKRVKGGKQGLVIPTHEKNLSIQLDDARLQRIMDNR